MWLFGKSGDYVDCSCWHFLAILDLQNLYWPSMVLPIEFFNL